MSSPMASAMCVGHAVEVGVCLVTAFGNGLDRCVVRAWQEIEVNGALSQSICTVGGGTG